MNLVLFCFSKYFLTFYQHWPGFWSTSSLLDTGIGESLPDLWKFMRNLLHNPQYNPKLIAWENLERGEFRISSLQDFYSLWRRLKRINITQDMWTKTIKLYDEKKYLHRIEGHRQVNKDN